MADKKTERGGIYQFTGKPADVTKVPLGDIEAAKNIAQGAGVDLEINSDGERTTMTPKVLVVVSKSKAS